METKQESTVGTVDFNDSFENKVAEFLEKNGLKLPIESIRPEIEAKNIMVNEAKAMLYKSILDIGEEIGAMSKDVSVEFGNTKYQAIGYENLNSILKILLRKYNLAIIPSITNCKTERYTAKNSKGFDTNYNSVELTLEIELISTVTGYSETKKSFARIDGSDDKTVAKAFTEAFKRWEFKTFHVTSLDSPDLDESPTPQYQQDDINIEKPQNDYQKPKAEPKKEEPQMTSLASDLLTLVKDKKMTKIIIESVFIDWGIKTTSEVPKGKEEQFKQDCIAKFNKALKDNK